MLSSARVQNDEPNLEVSGAKAPAHAQVYERLRELVLYGDLVPGQPVTIQGLAQSLDAGITPVREAIRRLIAEGALTFHGNRRVSVPILTLSDVEELIYIRKSLDSELTRRAVAHLAEADIGRLTSIDGAVDAAIEAGDIGLYLRENYRFHTALYDLARAPVTAGLADRLWLQFGPSLRVVCGRFGTQNLPDRHKEILEALSARDADAAAAATELDIEQGMAQVIDVLRQGGSD